MSAIKAKFEKVYRDFTTEGVSASGIHNPSKAEQRALGTLIDQSIANAALGALIDVSYSTRAELDADLAHEADSVALVYADPADANNDLYIKTGAAGAGAWGLTSALHDIVATLTLPFTGEPAGFGALEYLEQAVELIGRRDAAPATGPAAGSNTFIFANPANQSSYLKQVQAWALANGSFTLRIFTLDGGNFTQYGTDIALDLAGAPGLNTFTKDDFGYIEVPAGAYLGFYAADRVSYIAAGPTDFDPYYTLAGNAVGGAQGATGSASMQVTCSLGSLPDMATVEEDAREARTTTEMILASGYFAEDFTGYPSQGDIPDGTNNAGSANEFIFSDPFAAAGRLTRLRGYSPAGGSVSVYIRDKDGPGGLPGTLLRSQSLVVPAGNFAVDLDLTIGQGQYIGIRNPVTGTLRFTAGSVYPTPYIPNSAPGAAQPTLGAETLTAGFHIAFDYRLDRAAAGNRITIANSDRITLLCDSTGTPGFTPRRKGWLHAISMVSDYAFENFSKAGDDYSEILARIQNGSADFGSPFRDYNTTFALLASGLNDENQYDHQSYLKYLRQVMLMAQTYGAKTIVSSELKSIYGAEVISPTVRQMARQYSGHWFDLRPHARRFGDGVIDNPGYFAGFWYGIHPGIRTGHLYSEAILEQIGQLPRPKQSIKLFTPRDAFIDAADGAFDTIDQRAAIWQEIQIGERALVEEDEEYYDEIDDATYNMEIVESAYLKLMRGRAIAVDDYVLIDVILPCTYAGLERLTVNLGDGSLSAWILKADLAAGVDDLTCAPASVDVAADGSITLKKETLRGCIREDRLSIIVYKAGGFNLFAPTIDWVGIPGKPSSMSYVQKATGAELLSEPLCGEAPELAAWTRTEGGVVAAAPTDVPPLGVTKVATVSDTNRLGQDLDLSALDNTIDTEIEIEVAARYFPGVYASGGTYPADSAITPTSFDYRTLEVCLEYGGGAYSVPQRLLVGLGWKAARFRSVVPAGAADARLMIGTTSGELEIAEAHVRVV